jgi:putative DNA methylase
MSVATPKSQAKEPIQLDIILVCRKAATNRPAEHPDCGREITRAEEKIVRLVRAGLQLSENDRRVIVLGQLLTSIATVSELQGRARVASAEIERVIRRPPIEKVRPAQGVLFD